MEESCSLSGLKGPKVFNLINEQNTILKVACTLLGSERPKTKNDGKGVVPLEQKKFKVLQSGRNLQDW